MHLHNIRDWWLAKPCRSIPLATQTAPPVQFASTLATACGELYGPLFTQEVTPIKTCPTWPPFPARKTTVTPARTGSGFGNTTLICAFTFFFLLPAYALRAEPTGAEISREQTPQEKGLAIAIAADQSDAGFGDSTADMTMVLQTSKATPITRSMRQLTLEVEQDGDKSILVFDRPRDLKGTAILTHTHRTDPDDQWLYLPALKRVKRISSTDKSGPFMGSEFSYEDLASQEVEKYQYRYVREEPCVQDICDVIERIPTDKKSGYSHQIAWFDQSENRLQRVDYFDRKRELLKTMRMANYQQYLGTFWRPDEMHMINHQTEKSTVLQFANYRFQVGLDNADFTRNAVSRMR